jgi:hypothetical protein
MDVCDVDGNKVGSIARVFRHEMAAVGGGSSSQEAMPHDDVLEVKTGVLGLGKHLYVPFSALQDVTSGCVFVNMPKERIDEMGWDVKPDHIDEMS